jgi:2-dehydro-3-deoxy-D-arabinonate dehydratase
LSGCREVKFVLKAETLMSPVRIVRYWNPDVQGPALGAVNTDTVIALSESLGLEDASLEALLRRAAEQKLSPEDLVLRAVPTQTAQLSLDELNVSPDPAKPHLLQPVVAEEVWASGVTYERSRKARESESVVKDVYERVYDAVRPEIFFKATPSRCVGPNMAVGIRRDSRWSVPEPELALVIDANLRIVGFTLGNDMSSRDIEGENPLYLPQAKVFAACCSLGPAVLLAHDDAPKEFPISCRILRGGKQVFQGEASTRQMRRRFEDLVHYLGRCNRLAPTTVLLTGTGIIPPNEFSLQEGDSVEISSPPIGILRNPVKGV